MSVTHDPSPSGNHATHVRRSLIFRSVRRVSHSFVSVQLSSAPIIKDVNEPPMKTTRLPAALCGMFVVLLPMLHAAQAAERATAAAPAAAGVLTGSVSNIATRNLLEGARIELPSLGLAALTDNTGRFVLTGVPSG